jgi:hypothetical protein
LLDNGSVNAFPQHRISTQKEEENLKEAFSVFRAEFI